MDFFHLENQVLKTKTSSTQTRMLLIVFIAHRSSASHMTAVNVLDVVFEIIRIRGTSEWHNIAMYDSEKMEADILTDDQRVTWHRGKYCRNHRMILRQRRTHEKYLTVYHEFINKTIWQWYGIATPCVDEHTVKEHRLESVSDSSDNSWSINWLRRADTKRDNA